MNSETRHLRELAKSDDFIVITEELEKDKNVIDFYIMMKEMVNKEAKRLQETWSKRLNRDTLERIQKHADRFDATVLEQIHFYACNEMTRRNMNLLAEMRSVVTKAILLDGIGHAGITICEKMETEVLKAL